MGIDFGGLGPETKSTSAAKRQNTGGDRESDITQGGSIHPNPNISKNSLIWLLLNLIFMFPIGLIGVYWALKSMICEYRNDIGAAKLYNAKSRKLFVVCLVVLIAGIFLTFILDIIGRGL